jgi:hypothetical protein
LVKPLIVGVRISLEGVWIESRGSGRKHPWRWVLPGLAFPVVLILSLLVAVDHSTSILGYLTSARTDQHRATVWEYFQRHNSVAFKGALDAPQLSAQSELPTVQVLTEDDALLRLVRARKTGDARKGHADQGDRPYFEAVYLDESGWPREAKISSRGFSRYHMDPEKPSLRVKINRRDVGDGFRFVELSRPEDPLDMLNRFPEKWGQEMGLLTSGRSLVRVFVNGRYKGVYVRSYRPGESLGLSQARLPGTWFKGDLFNTRGTFGSLWETVEAWRLSGEETAHSARFFQDFLNLVSTSKMPRNAETLKKFWSFFDFESSAQVAAIHSVVGSSHVDNTHNHLYFLSPYKGRLETAVWDSNGFTTDQADAPVDLLSNELLKFCLSDPRWVHRRNQVMWSLLEGPAFPQRVRRQVALELESYSSALRADKHLGQLEVTPLGTLFLPLHWSDLGEWMEGRLAWYEERCRFLRSFLREARFLVQTDERSTTVVVDGQVAVAARLPDGTERLLYPGLAAEPSLFSGLRNGYRRNLPYLSSVPMIYRLPPADYTFFNAVTGEPVQPSAVGRPRPGRTVTVPQRPVPPTVTMGPGQLRLTRSVNLEPGQGFVVKAGTSLELDPGVNLVLRGPVEFRGTEEKPIVFEPSGDGAWGGVAVLGPQSSLRMSYTTLRGGSEFYHNGFHLKGMLSAYHCDRVEMDHCSFGRNLSGDDAVNIAHTRAHLVACRWTGALFDGLDLDAAGALLEGCRWHDSGNDGLDLMASRVVMRDSEVVGSGDKGISVGEGTELLAEECSIVSCDLGVQAKDAARAVLRRCQLRANRVALSSYRKKWLFSGPGQILTQDCTLEKNNRKAVLTRQQDWQQASDANWSALIENLEGWAGAGFPPTKRNLLR